MVENDQVGDAGVADQDVGATAEQEKRYLPSMQGAKRCFEVAKLVDREQGGGGTTDAKTGVMGELCVDLDAITPEGRKLFQQFRGQRLEVGVQRSEIGRGVSLRSP